MNNQITIFYLHPTITDGSELLLNPVVELVIDGVGNKTTLWNHARLVAEMS